MPYLQRLGGMIYISQPQPQASTYLHMWTQMHKYPCHAQIHKRRKQKAEVNIVGELRDPVPLSFGQMAYLCNKIKCDSYIFFSSHTEYTWLPRPWLYASI